MRNLLTCFALLFVNFITAQNITTLFEKSNGTKTPTYFEAIDCGKARCAIGKVKCYNGND
jgi:hypothetical protein